MNDNFRQALKREIIFAFAANPYPGDDNLRRSDMGEEPYLVEQEFRGKTNWQVLDAEFLDTAPLGLASALSFLSDAAFRFYLPAYLIADIEGKLRSTSPAFHLWYGLDDASKDTVVNPVLYGDRTWFHCQQERLALFGDLEVSAILSYLSWKIETDPFERPQIEQALRNYWLGRAGNVH
jgi:hypothetical protein